MHIVCFGDSNTFGYDPRGFFGGRYEKPWPSILAEQMDLPVVNEGQNGREIPGQGIAVSADLLIVMLGTNDLLQGASVQTAAERRERFLEQLKVTVFLVAPPLMTRGSWVPASSLVDASAALGERYRELAVRRRIGFADAGHWQLPLCFDGVHLTEEGHRIFAEKLYEILKKENSYA